MPKSELKRFSFSTNFDSSEISTGVLKGVVICEEGEAKGHDVFLNKQFIQDVVTMGKAFGDVGVKSRFGHPNMCSDALGTYLGRYRNFRLRKNPDVAEKGFQAIADLYLDETAKITPNGNLYEYVTKLAISDPGAFGNSIVFKPGDEIVKEKVDEETGQEYDVYFAVIEELYESDLVDSPAATDSLFSKFNASELASSVTLFMDEHPEVFKLLSEKPEIVKEFLNRYEHYKETFLHKNNIGMEKKELAEKLSAFEKAIQMLKSSFGFKKELN